ncbi:uncharacterized protein [Emydura macquarii macquarii]|uniref:uncharacterized protein isoform X2 n=1 Tax=Emydura macquarii macquarii TaxID=1129001 RepID=UPI00352A1973
MGNRWKTFCICLSGTLILASVALIACVAYICSVPAQLRECQELLKNDTVALTGKLDSLQKEKGALERQWDGARAEVTELRSKLAGTNQTLWETWEQWDSCRSWTDVLQNNITALKDQITRLAAGDPEAEEPGGKGLTRQQVSGDSPRNTPHSRAQPVHPQTRDA